MKKITTILSILMLGVFLVAGSAMALPFNDRSTPITPVNTALQNLFNDLTTNPGDIDVIADQENVAVFTNDAGGGVVSSFVFTDWTDNELPVDDSFGIYSYGNSSTSTIELFGTDATAGDQTFLTFFADGSVKVTNDDGAVTLNDFGNVFGFYYTSEVGTFYSEDDLNENDAAMALFYNGDGSTALHGIGGLAEGTFDTNQWLIAFDGTAYLDYNDAVVLVESIQPVPEPATMLLFGTGLIGMVAIGRKKYMKK